MSRINIPIYVSTYSYVKEVFKIKVRLPKILKYDLGQELFESSYKILKCIALANKAVEKTRYIERLIFEIETQWVTLRLLCDLQGLSSGAFNAMSERLGEIEKQALAWQKWNRTQKQNGLASNHAIKRDGVWVNNDVGLLSGVNDQNFKS